MHQIKTANEWHFGMNAFIGFDSAIKIIHSVAATAATGVVGRVDEVERRKYRTKSKVGARGEHPFLILKCVVGFAKVYYRGLFKNAQRLTVACALDSIFQIRTPLLRLAAVERPLWGGNVFGSSPSDQLRSVVRHRSQLRPPLIA